jgi:hypothetical protein
MLCGKELAYVLVALGFLLGMNVMHVVYVVMLIIKEKRKENSPFV